VQRKIIRKSNKNGSEFNFSEIYLGSVRLRWTIFARFHQICFVHLQSYDLLGWDSSSYTQSDGHWNNHLFLKGKLCSKENTLEAVLCFQWYCSLCDIIDNSFITLTMKKCSGCHLVFAVIRLLWFSSILKVITLSNFYCT
jgi:hypothetical protein